MKGKIIKNKNKATRTTGKKYLCSSLLICGLTSFCLIVFVIWLNSNSIQKVFAEESTGEIESALYTRQEFFGAQAIVPIPTAEARDNLAKLLENAPDNPQVLEKIVELDEKLSRFDEAETSLIHLAEIDQTKLENLAAFYHRRAQFEKEAEILRRILFSTSAENCAVVFERLIHLARLHDLDKYLDSNFYAEVTRENADTYPVFEKLINNLTTEKNYAEALKFVRQAKQQFPEKQSVLLEKEVEILLGINQSSEAEMVYQAAFNPFWSDAEADRFYNFLNGQDRLRAYGAELKAKIKKNPADFDAAIRFALYRNHDYDSDNDEITPIILRLEEAKKNWTTDELVTVTRLLLRENEADAASRFLYTLYVREDFQSNPDLRAKILYQLFEMFSDAETTRLPLVKGDLRFYEDAAKTDTSPGIATGILSLIFSDTNPGKRLDEQETKATRYFNRAAAYRIFLAYKNEFPTSPELAQMYLDIVRLYTATKETEIAEKTLNEFAERYENASDFPAVALKLADAFAATNQPDKTREIYQKILDYVGQKEKPFASKTNHASAQLQFPVSETVPVEEKQNRNDGINIPSQDEKPKYGYSYEPENNFREYLARKNVPVTYEEVLEKFVASLAGEKKTAEILALYSNEIAKYPDAEQLYEERLTWLEQTNLTEEHLRVYQTALARFQSRTWRDKLARWFLRENRQAEFADFSTDLVGKLNDVETQTYLAEFVDGKVSADDFNRQIYLRLYRKAHERFPLNIHFVNGLLRFYKTNKQPDEWRKLAAEYYFESKEVRQQFLNNLAEKDELRTALAEANGDGIIYELFRADASVRLSNYENAIAAYRRLNQLYPNTPEFSERLVAFTRSFGQKNRELLTESANVAQAQANFSPASAEHRTQSGEIFAELGSYQTAREEWEKLISTAPGAKEVYLDAATVYWDYFQYDDARRTIKNLREKFADDALYAFESGAIYEAQHKTNQAVGEYVKALGAIDDDTQKERARRRLAILYARGTREKKTPQNNLGKNIEAAFNSEAAKRKDASFLSLGYAEFLASVKETEHAQTILNRAIAQSGDNDFLEAARSFYQTEEIEPGEQFALKRLAEIAPSQRLKIGYRLQLAESFEANQDRDSAKAVLHELVRKFPANYGVLTATSSFFWRLGYENESVEVLQTALPRSKGAYRNALAQKLAGRLIRLDRLDSAELILAKLHAEDRTDTEIFWQLANVYVRQNDAGSLRKIFAETVSALKQGDGDRREIDDEIAGFREQMIDAFTKLKDYSSAVEQHIEIINRQPDDEELTDKAIAYIQRYGGAEKLLNYYLKTSAEAFKNYRWNVVLARIYQAATDYENAAKSYRAAIVNQPEMVELYLALADVETKRNDFDEAVKNLDTVLELTNDAPEYVKKKIEILKRAGRLAEVEAEQAKLPAEEKPKVVVDAFAEAQKFQNVEKEKSVEFYREAFGNLLANPIHGEMKAANISGYVRTLREEEPLDQINARLWELRGKLVEINEAKNSTDAGEARNRLSILDGTMTEAVGAIAKEFGTDEELAALHADWQRRIENISLASDANGTVSLVQDLSRRAGFGDLEEMILHKKLNESSNRQSHLQNLISFYNERGAYQKTFDVLEQTGSDDLSLKAETARLVGDREKELEALRLIYWKNEKLTTSADADVARYLEILRAENREELKSLTEKSSAYQLQLINFLLGKAESELAHSAINSANLPAAWKIARNAETSLALKEYGDTAECYFCDALQIDSIGNLVSQLPDKKHFLINDDWFRLSRQYGEWLREKTKPQLKTGEREFSEADKFTAALIEHQPRSSEEQAKLGAFYFDRDELKSTIEHFRLALEIEPNDKSSRANLGAAYYLSGKKDLAEDAWKTVLEDAAIESGLIYFQALQKRGLSGKARENLPPIIVNFLQTNNADGSGAFQKLIREIAASFENEAEKSAYFSQILTARPTDTSLAEMLVGENLIGATERGKFYELLISRSDKLSDWDYEFAAVTKRVWSSVDAESVYEQENEYRTKEPENGRVEWQRKYLEFLSERSENAKAARLVEEIEKQLSGRFARPSWLKLAELRLRMRGGDFDLAQAERFIGITVSESAAEIKLPSVERFNEVLQITRKENQAVAAQINESFFARMLALEQTDAANFTGLARVFFQTGKTEKAMRILQLMADAGDEVKRETALAEIAAMDVVKARSADAAKLSKIGTVSQINLPDALKLAAEIAAEFEQPDAAIRFRRQLFEIDPTDSANHIELAAIVLANGEKPEAANLLNKMTADRIAPRSARWRARLILREAGENTEFPDAKFDALSQFYQGIFAARNNQPETAAAFFTNSLLADKAAETSARQELIKLYSISDRFFAALKFAETDKSAKSDALLETLSDAAEKVDDFQKAVEFEKAKSAANDARIERLRQAGDEKNRRATNLLIDLENTRKL